MLKGGEAFHEDRRNFLRAQLLFWYLAAIDGHAKNFSLFVLPGGRYRMTPLYDVLSAWPCVARRRITNCRKPSIATGKRWPGAAQSKVPGTPCRA
ncbi:HipA domain-containing protein [Rhodoferax sp.]|uniref:HipA domain-containing protein n=1 Tax=Rhodoferax sp. TaxID=50421 RepID=UPI00341619F2